MKKRMVYYPIIDKNAFKYQEKYNIALDKYGVEHCDKAAKLARCTVYSFFDVVSLTDYEIDAAIAKYCKLD